MKRGAIPRGTPSIAGSVSAGKRPIHQRFEIHRCWQRAEHLPSPAVDPRIYRGEAIRDLYPETSLRDELLAWSLIVFASIGLLAVFGYVWTVLGRLTA